MREGRGCKRSEDEAQGKKIRVRSVPVTNPPHSHSHSAASVFYGAATGFSTLPAPHLHSAPPPPHCLDQACSCSSRGLSGRASIMNGRIWATGKRLAEPDSMQRFGLWLLFIFCGFSSSPVFDVSLVTLPVSAFSLPKYLLDCPAQILVIRPLLRFYVRVLSSLWQFFFCYFFVWFHNIFLFSLPCLLFGLSRGYDFSGPNEKQKFFFPFSLLPGVCIWVNPLRFLIIYFLFFQIRADLFLMAIESLFICLIYFGYFTFFLPLYYCLFFFLSLCVQNNSQTKHCSRC